MALSPEARAQCGNPARWDPWRGLRVIVIPTPTRRAYYRNGRTRADEHFDATFARALSPPHTAHDGDTLFALSVGEVPVDLTRLGLTAANVVARAIVRGVLAATSLPGLPAAHAL